MADRLRGLDVLLGHRRVCVAETRLDDKLGLPPKGEPGRRRVAAIVERERATVLVVGEELLAIDPRGGEVSRSRPSMRAASSGRRFGSIGTRRARLPFVLFVPLSTRSEARWTDS